MLTRPTLVYTEEKRQRTGVCALSIKMSVSAKLEIPIPRHRHTWYKPSPTDRDDNVRLELIEDARRLSLAQLVHL